MVFHTKFFLTAGSFTWTAPAGISQVELYGCGGGGGGGGGGANSGANPGNGGSGGGGAIASLYRVSISAGSIYNIVIGAGGSAGSGGVGADGTIGGSGASTSFSANGGSTLSIFPGAMGGNFGKLGGASNWWAYGGLPTISPVTSGFITSISTTPVFPTDLPKLGQGGFGSPPNEARTGSHGVFLYPGGSAQSQDGVTFGGVPGNTSGAAGNGGGGGLYPGTFQLSIGGNGGNGGTTGAGSAGTAGAYGAGGGGGGGGGTGNGGAGGAGGSGFLVIKWWK